MSTQSGMPDSEALKTAHELAAYHVQELVDRQPSDDPIDPALLEDIKHRLVSVFLEGFDAGVEDCRPY